MRDAPLTTTTRGNAVAKGNVSARPRHERTGWGLASAVGLLLAVIAPLILSRPTLESLSHPPVILALAITWYSAGRIWLLLMAGTNRPMSVTFWLFVYIFFGLVALANTVTQQFPLFDITYDETSQTAAQATILVGLAAYELGCLTARGPDARLRWARRLNAPTVKISRVTIIGLVGISAVAYFTLKFGLATRFSSRQTATETFLGPGRSGVPIWQRQGKASGILRLALDGIPVFVALYLMLSQWRLQRVRGRRMGLWTSALLFALALGVLLADNPVSTSRSRFLGVSIALLLAAWPLVTGRRFRVFALIVVAGTLFVYPYADYFRTDARVVKTASLNTQFRTAADFAMFQQEINVQNYVQSHGHTNGSQFLGVVLAFVPTQFWPDKPEPTGSLVFPEAANTLPTSVTIWGWAFVDGGIPWVFVVFLVYGAATAALEGAYRSRPRDRLTFAAAAVPLFAAFQTILLRGDPQTAMPTLLPLLVCLCAAVSVRGRVKRRHVTHTSATNEISSLPGSPVRGGGVVARRPPAHGRTVGK